MQKGQAVNEYLKSLPKERRNLISFMREFIKKNLPQGYKETMLYGEITYVVPLNLYSSGYLGDEKTPLHYIVLASRKNHTSLYLMHLADEKLAKQFIKKCRDSGKILEMEKNCIRFRKIEELPLKTIAESIQSIPIPKYIALCEKMLRKHPVG